MASSMPVRHLLVMVLRVWRGVMMSRSHWPTTFAGALSAFYHKVPVGHVEAGLRTYDKYSPWCQKHS